MADPGHGWEGKGSCREPPSGTPDGSEGEPGHTSHPRYGPLWDRLKKMDL